METSQRQRLPDRLTSTVRTQQHHADVLPIPARTEMSSHTPEPSDEGHWESVHKCSKCGYVRNLAKLGLRETTTGIAKFPRCEWSGQIDLQIVPRRRLDE